MYIYVLNNSSTTLILDLLGHYFTRGLTLREFLLVMRLTFWRGEGGAYDYRIRELHYLRAALPQNQHLLKAHSYFTVWKRAISSDEYTIWIEIHDSNMIWPMLVRCHLESWNTVAGNHRKLVVQTSSRQVRGQRPASFCWIVEQGRSPERTKNQRSP